MTPAPPTPPAILASVRRRDAAMRRDAERGDVVGWAITLPVALLLFATAMQAGMWFQARAMCHAAAVAGTQAGSAYGSSSDAGTRAATSYLNETGGTSIRATAVTDTLTATTISVGCTGAAITLLPVPGLTRVQQSSTALRERFTTPDTP